MQEINGIEHAIRLISETPYNRELYQRIAKLAMLTHIEGNQSKGSSFEDSLNVLNCLSFAKYQIDCGCNHLLVVTEATSELLLRVQEFFDREVIPCTAWPTPVELMDFIKSYL